MRFMLGVFNNRQRGRTVVQENEESGIPERAGIGGLRFHRSGMQRWTSIQCLQCYKEIRFVLFVFFNIFIYLIFATVDCLLMLTNVIKKLGLICFYIFI